MPLTEVDAFVWHSYEAHVKGLTQRHPDIPEELRGTYAGIVQPAVVEHLQRLGITALELMPVHQFVDDCPEDWDSGFGRSVGMFLNGQGIRENDSRGRPVTDVNCAGSR